MTSVLTRQVVVYSQCSSSSRHGTKYNWVCALCGRLSSLLPTFPSKRHVIFDVKSTVNLKNPTWDKPLYLIAGVATVQLPRILNCNSTPCITEPDFCYAFKLYEPRDFRHSNCVNHKISGFHCSVVETFPFLGC
jgi:hypothetical protein